MNLDVLQRALASEQLQGTLLKGFSIHFSWLVELHYITLPNIKNNNIFYYVYFWMKAGLKAKKQTKKPPNLFKWYAHDDAKGRIDESESIH